VLKQGVDNISNEGVKGVQNLTVLSAGEGGEKKEQRTCTFFSTFSKRFASLPPKSCWPERIGELLCRGGGCQKIIPSLLGTAAKKHKRQRPGGGC